jgi:hypothetical protein
MSRKNPSLFESVHGNAPDIAGQGIAHPRAAFLSVVLLLDDLGERVDLPVVSDGGPCGWPPRLPFPPRYNSTGWPPDALANLDAGLSTLDTAGRAVRRSGEGTIR